MATSSSPCLVESGLSDQAQRLTFYRNRIKIAKAARGGFLVFQEIRSGDLENLLNSLDESGFEIFELVQEQVEPGYRSRWMFVAFQTQTEASA